MYLIVSYFSYYKTSAILFALILLAAINISCSRNESISEISRPTPYNLTIPESFPADVNIPDYNPITDEGVKLGRYLFYDGRLSGRTHPDSLMSCGTCHLQSKSFECGIDHPKFKDGHPFGLTGIKTPHVMLPFINLIFNSNGYFWNGMIHPSNPNPNRRTLEDVVYMGIIAPHEMHGDSTFTVQQIQKISGYPDLFEKAFGTKKVSMKNISYAISQFIRTLISSESKFDSYMRGEEQLSHEEFLGWLIFSETADCENCHGGVLTTHNLFFNNGKQTDFSGKLDDSRDRFHFTNNAIDIGAYRAPTLRNIDLTGPYMHDGRFKTLDEVIDFYSEGVKLSPYISPQMQFANTKGIQLGTEGKKALKAFLLTFHDEKFITNPKFSRPKEFPDSSVQ